LKQSGWDDTANVPCFHHFFCG